jgi:hypothetical protein
MNLKERPAMLALVDDPLASSEAGSSKYPASSAPHFMKSCIA